ncbi:c-type cytochrome [Aurantivibrio plasticivorans]
MKFLIKMRIVSLTFCAFVAQVNALSPEAEEGKGLFPVCNACHNASIDPPLAPPMWGVQRQYSKIAESDEQFIELVASFAKSPSLDKVRFQHAVDQLGLMPAVAMPLDELKKVAAYIAEEQFEPPCAHWENNAARAEAAGDLQHAKKDRRKLQRFCAQ